MVFRSLVLGYHGCDLSVARQVVAGDDYQRPSQNEYDWLGNGLYFWEDSFARAQRWAEKDTSGKIKTPGVLGAVIDLGNCLNLIDVQHLEIVKEAHDAYRDICRATGREPAENKGKEFRKRYLDRAVFETLHHLREAEGKLPFDTVRAFFLEGQPLYESAGLRALDHMQICVRNPRQIIGYFLPRR